ncbi:mRNA splicing protein [Tieghemiomyces parasiticus]|uniref:Pre-mRNA-processing protein 45 n=1 Tax=Tieghemiomyces parasiticus TaxID=78921 RepID=A0A9W8E0F5_9FUNG|nr:mRNA splicing protein [Tieghemiomyces parasiticus]
MSSLADLLPKPKNQIARPAPAAHEDVINDGEALLESSVAQSSQVLTTTGPPPYGHRQGWVPRTASDFGDGGSFPEIHVVQYPLGLGRKKGTAKGGIGLGGNALAGAPLPLQVNAAGEVQYDAIARHGHAADRTIHSQPQDLVPLRERPGFQSLDTDALLERPDAETVKDTAERTRMALEKITQGKIAATQLKNVVKAGTNKDPEYIRYTPNQQGVTFNSGAKQRIVRMVEMPVDPFEPQRFKHKKVPRGPPSPPAPVMHSPPRKATAEEQRDWFIPPSISNWKNAKGFTIPLDKRLAADARGMQDVQINDNFAKMADALNAADRQAREGVRQRALQQQKLAQKERDAKEQHLRMLAQKAREARAGGVPDTPANAAAGYDDNVGDTAEGYQEREALRQERQREREREARMAHMGTEQRAKLLAKAQNRDLSEKIALGLAKPTASKESMFDQRLFNMSEGLDTGARGADEGSYNVYDKPLFTNARSSIYRPTRNHDPDAFGGGDADKITGMLKQDRFENGGGSGSATFKGFGGTDSKSTAPRDGPVQFEKTTGSTAAGGQTATDVFGLNSFMEEAKKGKRPATSGGRSPSPSKRVR